MIQLRRFANDHLAQPETVQEPGQEPGQKTAQSAGNLAPEVKAGELHIVSVPSRSRAEALIGTVAEQAATAVISPWRDADSASSNVSATLSATNVTLATWKYARKTNPTAICRSLTRFNRHHDAIVYVLDAARPDLKGAYTELVQQGALANFARQHAKAVVVVLVGISDEVLATTYCQPSTQATSVQTVVATFDSEQWQVHYWFRRGQLLSDQADVDSSLLTPTTSNGEAGQERHIKASVQASVKRRAGAGSGPLLYRDDALEPYERLPPKWRLVERFNELERYIEPGLSGVILLGFSRHDQLEPLLEQVHRLRAHGGPLLRVMVRERGAVIRLYEEKVLLQAGATMVVPGQLPLNRVLSLVEALQDWQFKQSLPTLDVLRSRLKLSAYKGYLPAAEFFHVVPQLANRNVSYQMDFALVFAHPASGLTQADIVSRCRVQREGDLITTTHEGIYIFLSACRPNDVDKVLFSLFNMPFSHLVAGEERAYTLSSVEFICERGVKSEAALPSAVMPASLFTQQEVAAREPVFHPAPTPPSVVARWPVTDKPETLNSDNKHMMTKDDKP